MTIDDALTRRRFSEEEVAYILRRAAEAPPSDLADDANGGEPAGMSLAELEQLSTDAGLDVKLVRQAVSDLDTQITDLTLPHMGPRPVLQLTRTVRGVLLVDEHWSIVQELDRMLGPGEVRSLPNTLHWERAHIDDSGHRVRSMQIVFRVSRGGTNIFIEQLVIGSTGGALALLGGGALVAVAYVVGVPHSPLVVGVLSAALLAAIYGIGRASYSRSARRRSEQLEALMSRLADRVRATATDPSTPECP